MYINNKPTDPTTIQSNYPSPTTYEQYVEPEYPQDDIIDMLKDALNENDLSSIEEYFKDKYQKESAEIVTRIMDILLRHENLKATVFALSFAVNLPITDNLSMKRAGELCKIGRYAMTKHVQLIQKELGITRQTRKQWTASQRANLKKVKLLECRNKKSRGKTNKKG